jgi:hypothetical protein
MRRFSDYKYVSPIPIESIEETIYNLAINKVKLDVWLLLFGGTEPM